MTKRITASHKFCNVGNRKVGLKFAAGDISSDGGVLLIKEADRLIGLMSSISCRFAAEPSFGKVACANDE